MEHPNSLSAKKIHKGKKAKNRGGRMLKGALVGATLGVVAGFLLAPESGKKLRADITRLSGNFYKYLAPKVKKLGAIGEAEYHTLITEGAARYAKEKHLALSGETMKTLISEAKRSWNKLTKNS